MSQGKLLIKKTTRKSESTTTKVAPKQSKKRLEITHCFTEPKQQVDGAIKIYPKYTFVRTSINKLENKNKEG